MNPKFNPLPDGYEAPEVRLEMFLKPYDRPPTPKTPVLTGYVRVTKAHLAALSALLNCGTSSHINLRVALWDSKVGPGVEGVIEYREYNPPALQEHSPSSPSHWY
jgi:hypothetical protein